MRTTGSATRTVSEMRHLPEIEAIRSFSIVAEELNFRRAAERLAIDHSALSRRVSELERRLGFALLERSTREVRLTEAGKVFLSENAALFAGFRRSIETARLVAEGRSGVVRIGYMSFAAAVLLPALIREFKSRRPDVRFQLTYLRSHAQKQALTRGEIDIGLMIGPWRSEMFDTTRLTQERLGVFFSKSDKALARRRIGVTELAAMPLIMGSLEQWDLYRWMLDDMFLRNGVVPNVVLEASSIAGMLGLVRAGLGVSLFPSSIAKLCPSGVGMKAIAGCDFAIETIGVASRRRGAVIDEFVAMLKQNAR